MADEVQKSVHRRQNNAEKTSLDMPEHIPSHKVPLELTQSDIYAGVTKYVGKLWGVDRRSKNKQKSSCKHMVSFLNFQVTGIICGVHNTDHFTIHVVHLWCFVLIKFNLQLKILSSYMETSTEGAQSGYHEL